MTASTRFNDDETAGAYERLMLPRVFRPWGSLLLDRVGLEPGMRVLDVATGPGTLARLAAERVGPQGSVLGLDFSGPMLAQARAKPPLPGGAPLDYVQGSADALPFGDASFDAVLCQQGLQFFPDQAKALAEMRRVLRPGGRLGLATWDGPRAMGLMAAFLDALEAVRGQALARPIQWLDAQRLGALLAQAGFTQVQAQAQTLAIAFDDAAQALACVDGTSAGIEVRQLDPGQRRRFDDEAALALGRFAVGGGLQVPSRSVLALARA